MDTNKILLVEDDYALSLGTKFSLEAENFIVLVASSLNEAKQLLFSNEDIDLILLDLMLPDGNGYDYLEEIKKTKKDIPVIFVSAVSDEVNIVQGLEKGADDYITKPFGVKELISRIKVVLRRANKNSLVSSNLTTSDIEIDLSKAIVYLNGKSIYLTPSEYRLLIELIKNKNKVIEREILIERLWDVDSNFIDDNTLSVYIKRLRDKIEDNNSQKIITVRGIGYSFVDN